MPCAANRSKFNLIKNYLNITFLILKKIILIDYKNIRLNIWYFSILVTYEIVGNDLLVDILKLNDVRIRVNEPDIRLCTDFMSIAKRVRESIVIRNTYEKPLKIENKTKKKWDEFE